MFVKLLTGARAGEVCEMKYADARTLLDLGRAEEVIFDGQPAAPAVTAIPVAAPAAKKGKKR